MTLAPSPTLDAALDVFQALNGAQMDSGDGVLWRRTVDGPEAGGFTLYHGSAGIALFHIELARATGDQQFLAIAERAANAIVTYLDGRTGLSVAPATGWPGYAFALTEIADATGRSDLREVASRCLTQLRSQASTLGSGIGWIEPMPFSDITGFKGDREIFDQSVGASGAGSYFLHAHRRGVHDDALSWAVEVGNRLLDVAEPDPTGRRWRLMADMPFPFTTPNFAHGGAGVGYFMADLYRACGDVRFLDAAKDAARYVAARATPVGEATGGNDAALVCHTEEANPPIFYLGACHGPVGTGRLFALLTEITGDPTWVDTAHRLMRGLAATGAPEVRSTGLWNNHGQCCGDAGIGDYALMMADHCDDDLYADIARRCSAVVMDASVTAPSTPDGVGTGRVWNQAEHRVRPNFLQRQTGYMQGAAGIGSFLLNAAAAPQGRSDIKISLPDMQVWDLPTVL